jgi:hypothetical protein
MLTPQVPTVAPTAVYAPVCNLGLGPNAQGQLTARVIQLRLQGATVDANGKWQPVGGAKECQPFTFTFDASGNVTGLPADLAPAAAAITNAWQALEAAIGAINAVRKIV